VGPWNSPDHYHSKIHVFHDFERDLGVPVLPLTPLTYPPNGLCIPLICGLKSNTAYTQPIGSKMRLCWPSWFPWVLFVICTVMPVISMLSLDLLTAHPEHLVELKDKPILYIMGGHLWISWPSLILLLA
jgi:hypothetical protein